MQEGEELVGREGDKVGKPLGSQQPFPDTAFCLPAYRRYYSALLKVVSLPQSLGDQSSNNLSQFLVTTLLNEMHP